MKSFLKQLFLLLSISYSLQGFAQSKSNQTYETPISLKNTSVKNLLALDSNWMVIGHTKSNLLKGEFSISLQTLDTNFNELYSAEGEVWKFKSNIDLSIKKNKMLSYYRKKDGSIVLEIIDFPALRRRELEISQTNKKMWNTLSTEEHSIFFLEDGNFFVTNLVTGRTFAEFIEIPENQQLYKVSQVDYTDNFHVITREVSQSKGQILRVYEAEISGKTNLIGEMTIPNGYILEEYTIYEKDNEYFLYGHLYNGAYHVSITNLSERSGEILFQPINNYFPKSTSLYHLEELSKEQRALYHAVLNRHDNSKFILVDLFVVDDGIVVMYEKYSQGRDEYIRRDVKSDIQVWFQPDSYILVKMNDNFEIEWSEESSFAEQRQNDRYTPITQITKTRDSYCISINEKDTAKVHYITETGKVTKKSFINNQFLDEGSTIFYDNSKLLYWYLNTVVRCGTRKVTYKFNVRKTEKEFFIEKLR